MFDYLTRAERHLIKRVTVYDADGVEQPGWLIAGKLRAGSDGVSDLKSMSSGIRELSDVEGRLAQMDEYGTDIQVLYPTMFLRPPTSDPKVEIALCGSYNRWLADRTAKAAGRMYWVVVPPLLSVEAAIEEIRFGAAHGAKGVFWRGFENGKLPSHPYFEPVLEVMDELSIPMCVHAGNGTPMLVNFMPDDRGIWRSKLSGVTTFHSLLSSDVPKRYPNVRFGFVELAAQWIPYVLKDHILRATPSGRSSQRERDSWKEIDASTLMAENRLYVSCQTNDDLAYILQYAGPHNLIAGSDFGHADTSSELLALQRIHETPGVAPEDLDAILDANPRALYGL